MWEKPGPDPESLFNFGSSRSLCGHFLSKNMGKLKLDWWLYPASEQESDSQIWKIAGPGFKNFGTGEESKSEKVTPATSGLVTAKIDFSPDPVLNWSVLNSVERIEDYCGPNPVQYFHCVIQSDPNPVELSKHLTQSCL